jgi:thiopurine S-methyltransferase
MQHAFWLERWEQNWSSLELPSNCKVFVPFCGKTKDLLWLRQQGHHVIAVELSLIAVEAFFTESKLPVKELQVGEFKLFETDGIQIYCGDFFKLPSDILRCVQAVYDRASLVALPTEMRVQYAEKMRDMLFSSIQILLVAFDYPQHEMQGPPFSV